MNITRRKYTSFHQNFQEFDKKLIAMPIRHISVPSIPKSRGNLYFFVFLPHLTNVLWHGTTIGTETDDEGNRKKGG